MADYTVLEWGKLPYEGNDTDRIPQDVAEKIAAVAETRAESLRTRVLDYGVKALQARGVVGVIAAGDCALEILPKIDTKHSDAESDESRGAIRKRLVHMLAVAYGLRIDVGAVTRLDWQNETLLEILIRIFADKLTEMVRKGMPRRYIEQADDLPVLRGALNVTRQFTVLAANPARLACRFDELSENTPLNQIIKAAIMRLQRITRSNDNQRQLRELAFIYADIAEVAVAALPWHKVVINRTNERWREIFDLAKLLLGSRYQSTTSGSGDGFALLFEMNVLFEEYVGRLLKRAALMRPGFSVHLQGGRDYCLVGKDDKKLFQTKPDILLKQHGKIVRIIDTKWKQISPAVEDSKRGVNQGDIYQMMAYGQIYDCQQLMLLYPHHRDLNKGEGVLDSYAVTKQNIATLHVASFDVASDKNMDAEYFDATIFAPS